MNQSAHPTLLRQRGFTLVEAIAVMVITGILAGIMVLFISKPVQQYVDASGRADMGDEADLALRRMARELHGALPNSLRVSDITGGTMIEFVPVKTGGIYLDASDDAGSAPAFSTGGTQFTVVGSMTATPTTSDYIVVYNLGSGYTNADAYAASGNRAGISGVGSTTAAPWGTGTTITMSSAFPVFNSVPVASPSHRFQVVTAPVTFRCAPLTSGGPVVLTRHWGYGFNSTQVDPNGSGSYALLADNVSSCSFKYQSAANIQHGLVGLNVILTRPNSNESVALSQQVNVENTP